MKKVRIRCPVCGMTTDLSRLESAKVPELTLWVQEFGGKKPVEPGAPRREGRGRAPGRMIYTRVTDPKLIERARGIIKERIKKILHFKNCEILFLDISK